jgi:hypothetical protein
MYSKQFVCDHCLIKLISCSSFFPLKMSVSGVFTNLHMCESEHLRFDFKATAVVCMELAFVLIGRLELASIQVQVNIND